PVQRKPRRRSAERRQLPVEQATPFRVVGQRPEAGQRYGGDPIRRGRGGVLYRLGGRREVSRATVLAARQIVETAVGLVPVGAPAVVHDGDRASEPGVVTRRLIGVQERGGGVDVVLQQPTRLRPADDVPHPPSLVPCFTPDSFQHSES